MRIAQLMRHRGKVGTFVFDDSLLPKLPTPPRFGWRATDEEMTKLVARGLDAQRAAQLGWLQKEKLRSDADSSSPSFL